MAATGVVMSKCQIAELIRGTPARIRGARLRWVVTIAALVGIGTLGEWAEAAPERGQGRQRTTERAPVAGPLQIMVSLSQQRLTVFEAGVPVASSAISSGQSGYETPTGVYAILQKNRHHESNIYSGAPMPYMQRLTWSGIALHEGHLPGYRASHGCIRLPGAFASRLFAMTRIGARVIVAHEPLAPRPIEHDRLFQPPPADGKISAPSANGGGLGGYVISAAAAMPLTSDRPASKSVDGDNISILVSRQTGRIYIRRNFEPLYEGPVVIKDPAMPLGTHVFTASTSDEGSARLSWNVVTVSAGESLLEGTRAERLAAARADAAAGIRRTWETSPAAALERIEIEPDVAGEIAEIARPGLSLVVTDRGLGTETGKGTDFVVQTR